LFVFVNLFNGDRPSPYSVGLFYPKLIKKTC